MKKLTFLILSIGLSACDKPQNCLHTHIGSAVLEYCGENVICEEDYQSNSKIKVCNLKELSQ